ncbi:hypothetical protein L3X38_024152 [Prunus dulcis]|uniref:RNase H type-1 domain-containing protein n=1 Tax=Prunus dulcis TaxID=3755 RepID=A0AAD4VZ97_PRUDU|nr:hypothetical protein L3X38_024152 [Prunus dulcis]
MWQPPHENSLKINVDGAWKPRTTEGGVSVFVRDSKGKFVASCATKLTNVFSAPQVEALAARTDHWGRFYYIRRTANGVAHRLACFALHIGGSLYWFEEPPDFISDILYEDCNS